MISAADSEHLARALTAQGVPANTRATDSQLARALRQVPIETAEHYLTAIREQAAEGVRCWELGHDAQIEHWRRTAIDRAVRS